MRLSERPRSDLWLLGLALAGGVLDATSYVGLGKVFTANMTGNTVLLAVALARGSGTDAARSAVALGGFRVGAAAGVMTIALGDLRGRRPGRRTHGALVAGRDPRGSAGDRGHRRGGRTHAEKRGDVR